MLDNNNKKEYNKEVVKIHIDLNVYEINLERQKMSINNFRLSDNEFNNRKKKYLVLDSETATLGQLKELAKTSNEKQAIGLARPLIYDIGWQVVDNKKKVYSRRSILIQETFFVPQVFNTAYYADKRPLYIEKIEKGEIEVKTWNEAMKLLEQDLEVVNLCLAYNSAFDYKKAIPFTEKYIKNLYSNDFEKWIKGQIWYVTEKILNKNGNGGKKKKTDTQSKEKNLYEYDNHSFDFRGKKYPLGDLWGIACNRLINIPKYKAFCINNGRLSASGEFFSTSAESTFAYLDNQYNFVEEHTALSDTLIETDILYKALSKGKIETGLAYFPFRNLGTTVEYIEENYKKIGLEEIDSVINLFELKVTGDRNFCQNKICSYINRLNLIKNLIIN